MLTIILSDEDNIRSRATAVQAAEVMALGGDDWIIGSNLGDHLFGGDGDDTLSGRGAGTLLDGGTGNDSLGLLSNHTGAASLFGGDGDDTLQAWGSDLVLDGGAGNDLLQVTVKASWAAPVLGGNGDDQVVVYLALQPSPVAVSIDGGDGFDTFRNLGHLSGAVFDGRGPTKSLTFGDGSSFSLTGFESFSLDGFELGADGGRLRFGEGDDDLTIWGGDVLAAMGAGNDIISDSFAEGTLLGQAGDDNIAVILTTQNPRVPGKVTRILGGAGTDTLSASFWAEDLTIDLSQGPDIRLPLRDDGTKVVIGGFEVLHLDFETVSLDLTGSAGADDITVNFGTLAADLGAGDDRLTLSWLTAGTLDGGTGVDRLVIEGLPSGPLNLDAAAGTLRFGGKGPVALAGFETYEITLSSEGGHLVLGEGDDTVAFSAIYGGADSFIDGAGGNDLLGGGAAMDQIRGGSGNDTINGEGGFDNLWGLEGNDAIFGGAGNDGLFGEAGEDTLDGGDLRDAVFGGDGNDRLLGGLDNDTLAGGGGVDVMVGGAGRDVFFFGTISDSGTQVGQIDNIFGFELETAGKGHIDRIDLHAMDADLSTATDDAFHFIGQAEFTGAGQIRVQQLAGGVYVLVNVDADLLPEMRISLPGLLASDFEASDFLR